MTSIENALRDEYRELLTYAETVYACRERMTGHIVALEGVVKRSPGGEALVTQLREEAGYDQLELAALDDHRQREGDSAA